MTTRPWLAFALAALMTWSPTCHALAQDGASPRLLPLPDVRQHTVYACGAGALQAVLAYYGIDARQDTLMAALGTNERIGTRWWEIVRVAGTYGIAATAEGNMTIGQLESEVDSGVPVLIAIQAWAHAPPTEAAGWRDRTDDGHYVVAIGHDAERLYFEDPAMFGIGWIAKSDLPARWHDFDEYGTRLDHFGIAFRRPNGADALSRRVVPIQ